MKNYVENVWEKVIIKIKILFCEVISCKEWETLLDDKFTVSCIWYLTKMVRIILKSN